MKPVCSPAIKAKLSSKHKVSLAEVEECFLNRGGAFLEDTREEHKTIPASQWFIAPTNSDRNLKVVFVLHKGIINIKTAYEPNKTEVKIYERYK